MKNSLDRDALLQRILDKKIGQNLFHPSGVEDRGFLLFLNK
jgi:hypothetical protein